MNSRDEIIEKLVDEFKINPSPFNNTATNKQHEKFWTLNRLTKFYYELVSKRKTIK